MRFLLSGLAGILALSAFGQTTAPMRLTLAEAGAMALKNHPQVLGAQNEIFARNQQVIEAKSAYYPAVNGDLTGSAANYGGRIGAGFLTDSRLFDRFGDGIVINQLISDFGRTANLVAQSRLQASASEQDYQAARYSVLLHVSQAYFNALRAQALVNLAQKTVEARQTQANQVGELARNNLRSQLDVSFADVTVSQAKLLLIRSQNAVQAAFADLTRSLGAQQAATYELAEEATPPSPGANVEDLVRQAMGNRPELTSIRLSREAAYKFEEAERDLKRPNATFAGVAGYMPYIDQITPPHLIPKEYAGAAINLQIPIFNGHLYTSRREEAHYHALEADQHVRDLEDSIARDVRTAWSDAQTAYQAKTVTAEYLREASLALELATSRFQLQLSDIVALTQSQLNQTEAQIEDLNAKYDYQSLYAALEYAIGALR